MITTDQNMSSLSLFLDEIRKYPILTAEEERELAQKIAQGDLSAKEKFINSNLRFVVSIAKKFHVEQMSLMDLIQEGSIGLIKAVEKFNPEKGYRFSTYAKYWIMQSILRAIDLKCDPNVISLQIHVDENGETELGDLIPDDNLTPEEIAITESQKDMIEDLITNSHLTDAEEKVIRMRYFDYADYSKIAKTLGKTRMSIQNIERKALKKIRLMAKNFPKEFFL